MGITRLVKFNFVISLPSLSFLPLFFLSFHCVISRPGIPCPHPASLLEACEPSMGAGSGGAWPTSVFLVHSELKITPPRDSNIARKFSGGLACTVIHMVFLSMVASRSK